MCMGWHQLGVVCGVVCGGGVVDGGGKEEVMWQCLNQNCHICDGVGHGPCGWDIFYLVTKIVMPV